MALKSLFPWIQTLILLHLPVISPANFTYPAVFNFGDSNSDTGGLAAGVAFPVGAPNGETYFNKPSGRFCDGRLIIDFLMDSMNLPYLNAYLDSVGAPSFSTGCNFAAGGATILPASPAARCPFSFGFQVAQFIRFKARVLELLGKDKRFQKILPSGDYFRDGLYTFDVGQNDIDGAFYSESEDQVAAFIPTILSEFQAGLERLYDEGAKNLWIHGMGPLGCLPRIIATFGQNASKLDRFGCVDSHNRVANLFNSQLHSLCAKLGSQFIGVNVTYVDIFAIKLNLVANFSQFGFKEGIAACCGYGGGALNYDSRIACGETKSLDLNGSMVSANPCDNATEYVNWDGNHYTEAANSFVSSQLLTGKFSDPPTPPPLSMMISPKNENIY